MHIMIFVSIAVLINHLDGKLAISVGSKMIPPYFDRAQGDKQILNQAVKHLGKQLKGIPYKGITIKEALSFIGYPNVSLDVKG